MVARSLVHRHKRPVCGFSSSSNQPSANAYMSSSAGATSNCSRTTAGADPPPSVVTDILRREYGKSAGGIPFGTSTQLRNQGAAAETFQSAILLRSKSTEMTPAGDPGGAT